METSVMRLTALTVPRRVTPAPPAKKVKQPLNPDLLTSLPMTVPMTAASSYDDDDSCSTNFTPPAVSMNRNANKNRSMALLPIWAATATTGSRAATTMSRTPSTHFARSRASASSRALGTSFKARLRRGAVGHAAGQGGSPCMVTNAADSGALCAT